MQLKIYSLDGILFEGEINKVTLPGTDGEITILKDHIPLLTTLKKGVIRYDNFDYSIERGFAEIKSNSIVVLVD